MDVLVVEVWEGALADERTLSGFAAKQSVPLTRFSPAGYAFTGGGAPTYLLCGDHQRAEDLVQDAYLALYRRFGDTLPLAAPVAYARKAIVNAHLSHRRRRASTEQITDTPPDSAAASADLAETDAMWRVLAALPDRQRTVLVLRYYLDLPDAEIAGLLGCRESTVRSLATRAFATLRTSPVLTEGRR